MISTVDFVNKIRQTLAINSNVTMRMLAKKFMYQNLRFTLQYILRNNLNKQKNFFQFAPHSPTKMAVYEFLDAFGKRHSFIFVLHLTVKIE